MRCQTRPLRLRIPRAYGTPCSRQPPPALRRRAGGARSPNPARAAAAPQCPVGDPQCTYAESRLALNGNTYQTMMLSGGADWSTQFWVRDAQGQVLLAISPLRGNAYLAVQRADDGRPAPNPAVRLISFHYAPGDLAVAVWPGEHDLPLRRR